MVEDHNYVYYNFFEDQKLIMWGILLKEYHQYFTMRMKFSNVEISKISVIIYA